jgi:TP901 family phage tail tape measure protein
VEIFELFGTIAINTANAAANLGSLASKGASVAGSLGADIEGAAARGLNGIGGMSKGIIGHLASMISPVDLVVGAVAGVVGIGKQANEAFGEFEGVMKNVSTLIDTDGQGAISRFGDALLKVSIDTGKGVEDLGAGLYQVISAVGETADSMQILDQNAKAAAGGLATTEQAIGLSSAVTKAWGDTTKEANLKALDLAQTAVKLGKTTFPEMASAIGKVAPLAHTLNITQEELFASMSSLSGVTGSTAEVSTQLQNVYNAMLKPTKEMQVAFQNVASELDKQGKLAGGPLVDAWRQAGDSFKDYLEQLDGMKAKQAALDTSTDAGKKAYRELGDEIKSLEDRLKSSKAQLSETTMGLGGAIVQSVGFGESIKLVSEFAEGNTGKLGKMFGSVQAINAVNALGGPLAKDFADKVRGMGEAAGASNEAFQKNIDEGAQFGAALNAVLVKIGGPIDAIIDSLSVLGTGALKGLLELINGLSGAQIPKDSPLSGLADAFGKLGAVIGPLASTAWDKILKPLFEILKPLAEGAFQVVLERLRLFVDGISTFVTAISQLLQGDIVGAIKTLFNGIIEQFAGLGQMGLSIGEAILKSLAATPIGKALEPFIKGIGDGISSAFNAATGFVNSAINTVKTAFSSISSTAKDAFNGVGDTLKSIDLSKMLAAAPGAISSFINGILEQVQTAFGSGLDIGKRILDSIASTPVGQALKPFTDAIGAGFDGAFKSVGNFIQPIIDMLKPLGEGAVKVALERFDALVKGFNSFKDAISKLANGDLVGAVKTLFNGVIEQFKSLGSMGLIVGEAILKSLASTPVGKLLKPFTEGLQKALSEAWELLKDPKQLLAIGENIISSLVGSIKREAARVSIVAGEIAGKILKGFTDLPKALLDIGDAIVTGITKGIKDNIDKLTNGLKALGEGAIKTLKGLLGIKSPSQVMYEEVGLPIVQGIAQGVTDNIDLVINAARDLVRGAKNALDQIANGDYGQAIGEMLRGISDAFDFGGNGVDAAVNSFVQGVQGALTSLAKGDWIGAIVAVVAGAINAVLDLFNGANKSLQEANQKLKAVEDSFSVINGGAFVKITKESRGWFADLFGGPATIATINEFAVKVAKTLESGLLSGFANGVKAFFNGGSLIDGLRSGIRDAIINALIDAFVQGAIIKGALGKLFTDLSEAIANGTDPTQIIQQIGAVIPGLVDKAEKYFGPLRDVINQALPQPASSSTSGTQLPSSDGGFFLAPPAAAQGTFGLNSDAIPRFENAVTEFRGGVADFRGGATDIQGAAGSLTTVINRLVNEGIRVSSIGANGLSTDLQVL